MRLTGKELDRLTVFTLAELARRRRARGRPLNAPEAVAIVVDEILEWVWDGMPLAEVIERAGRILGQDDVMDGVPALVPRIEVDALFPSGTTLVVVTEPFGPAGDDPPGGSAGGEGSVPVGPRVGTTTVMVHNTADVPVAVTSHYHFFEANPRLRFDRRTAYGMRLDAPAGTSMRWEPGERREVGLVPIGGDREVWGFSGLVDGPLDTADAAAVLEEAIRRGFGHEERDDAG